MAFVCRFGRYRAGPKSENRKHLPSPTAHHRSDDAALTLHLRVTLLPTRGSSPDADRETPIVIARSESAPMRAVRLMPGGMTRPAWREPPRTPLGAQSPSRHSTGHANDHGTSKPRKAPHPPTPLPADRNARRRAYELGSMTRAPSDPETASSVSPSRSGAPEGRAASTSRILIRTRRTASASPRRPA